MSSEFIVRELLEIELKMWDEFVDNSKWGDILQFHEWGEVKKEEDWKSLKVGVFEKSGESDRLLFGAQILYKKAGFLGNYGYVPHGPIFTDKMNLETALPLFIAELKKITQKYNIFTLEIEPKIGVNANLEVELPLDLEHFVDPELSEILIKNGFKKTPRNVQPKYKLYYDLSATKENLLGLCHKNTRYNIKLAQKKGVVVKEHTPDSPEIHDKIEQFYNLLLETQKRAKGYPIRPLKSFVRLFEVFKGTNNISLFEASYEGDVIAINISQRTKYWSSSFYAASNRLHPQVKAMYLLRWESILAAKKYGSKTYDFWGVVPNSGQHSGYSDHKLSFGGYRIDNYGLFVLPINPLKSWLWGKIIFLRTGYKDNLRKLVWKFKKD